MDVFIEHLVRKKPTTLDRVKTIALALGGALIAAALFFTAFSFKPLFMICLLAAVGVLWLTYYLLTMMMVEYEYILTNGEIDVDKIVAKRKRKRLITVQIRTFNEFGRYDPEKLQGRTFDTKVLACKALDDRAYYAALNHGSLGSVLLVFNPDERILDGIEQGLQRQVKANADFGNRPGGDSEDQE